MQPVDFALVLVDALQVHADHDAVLWDSLIVQVLQFLIQEELGCTPPHPIDEGAVASGGHETAEVGEDCKL